MNDKFIAKINLQNDINETKLYTNNNPFKVGNINETNDIPEFKQVLQGMVTELNSTVKAPDEAMKKAVSNNGADLHDVMIAISRAEIGINLATQITTKVVQAYEKVTSIQV